MPTWGLTEDERNERPWGLEPALLLPRKVTTDPIHGDVHTTVLEQALIDTAPFQRLRRVRQLGMTHEVYPGATHTRFSHSLGALRVAQDLLDGVISQHEGRRPVPDLIAEWLERDETQAHRDIAQAVVVTRLGALLHDLCHVPFGHTIEDDLDVLVSHDENGERFAELWEQLASQLPQRIRRHLGSHDDEETERALVSVATLTNPDGELHRELRPLIISKDDYAKRLVAEGSLKYPFAADLVGNTICADLLDYLLRDHLYAGLPASIGRRFTSAFFIVPTGRGPYSHRVALNIMQDGYERTDVISELLKALRYRYELQERALYHHAKLAADVMIGKALDLWARATWLEEATEAVSLLDDVEERVEALDDVGLRAGVTELLQERWERARDTVVPNSHETGPRTGGSPAAKPGGAGAGPVPDELRDLIADHADEHPASLILARQRERLESEVLAHGDDGLLERIAALDREPVAPGVAAPVVNELLGQSATLGEAILDRQLFAVGGHVGIDDAPAAKLYDEFGSIESRTRLQDEAQRFAEIGRKPQVLVWLPDPGMRLKLARVLVDNGEHINEFAAYEDARGDRGGDIYRAHRRLWSLWVFVSRDLDVPSREAVLVYLAAQYGVSWERMRDDYGRDPGTWIMRHGLSRLLGTKPDDGEVEALLPETEQVSARGPDLPTIGDVVEALRQLPKVDEALQKRERSREAKRRT